MRKYLCVMVLAVFTISMYSTACAPVLIGAIAYKSSKNKKARQDFTKSFNANNTDREAKDLEPLDWCVEASRFDRQWALKDKDCRKQLGVKPSTKRRK